MSTLTDIQKLADAQEKIEESVPHSPIKSFSDLPPVADCIRGGGTKYGHLNQAGGYCCPHHGNTCGYHTEW